MTPSNLSALIKGLAARSRIGADDVIALRRAVFGGDYMVTHDEADALIDLDAAAIVRAPEWRAFYKEAITDFLVRQQSPAGYVDEAGASWLIEALLRDGRVRGDSELELLVHILDSADEVPSGLVEFTLTQIKAKVTEDGRIGAEEASMIRKALYAPASNGNIAITRSEAEILFDINDACRGAANDPAWTDLFTKAVVASVMTVSGYAGLSRQEALRRQIWLETPELGDFFGRMVHGLGGVWRDPVGAMRNDSHDGVIADNVADQAAWRAAEPVDASEAQWLADRMRRDGVLDEGEQRVVDFLRREAPAIHPTFRQVLEPAAPGAARAFGRRGAR